MMGGGDEGKGGRGCCHDSLTPSFTVSQGIKCQTNQLSSGQTSTGTGHDGIYLPGVHINKIKRFHTKSIVLRQPADPHQPLRRRHHLFSGSLFTLSLYPSWLPLLRVFFFFPCLTDVCLQSSLDFEDLGGKLCRGESEAVLIARPAAAAPTSRPRTPTRWLNVTLTYHTIWPRWTF